MKSQSVLQNNVILIRVSVVLFLLLIASVIYGVCVTSQLDFLQSHDRMIASQVYIAPHAQR